MSAQPSSGGMYSDAGFCFWGNHWSEELDCVSKSCRKCTDARMAVFIARREKDRRRLPGGASNG